MPSETKKQNDTSQKDVSLNRPPYPCEFYVTLKRNTGPDKDNLQLTFHDDPPNEVKLYLRTNQFHYNLKNNVWFSKTDEGAKQIAQRVIDQGLTPKQTQPEIAFAESGKDISAIAKRPKLVAVTDKFWISNGDYRKRVRELINSGLNAIELVHKIEKSFKTIPITIISASDSDFDDYAAFYGDFEKNIPTEIQVSSKKDVCDSDVVHEIGHYLDCSLGNRTVEWKKEFLRTIKNTSVYKAISNIKFSNTTVKVSITDENGTRTSFRPLSNFDNQGIEFRNYLCDDAELFARGYEQYIASKTGLLIRGLDRDVGYKIHIVNKQVVSISAPMLWEKDDFKKTGDLFDQLFDELGWKVK